MALRFPNRNPVGRPIIRRGVGRGPTFNGGRRGNPPIQVRPGGGSGNPPIRLQPKPPIGREGPGGIGTYLPPRQPPGGFPIRRPPPFGGPGGGTDIVRPPTLDGGGGGYPVRPPGIPYPPAQGGPVFPGGGGGFQGGNPPIAIHPISPIRPIGTYFGGGSFGDGQPPMPGRFNNPLDMSRFLTDQAFSAQHPVDQALPPDHGLHPAQVQLLRDHYDNNLLHQTLASQGGGMGFAPQRPGVMY